MRVCLISAISENGVIGRDGRLPWHLPDDMRFFKRTTMGCPIIMGRRTHESNNGPLPGRLNIVVSRTLPQDRAGVEVVRDLDEALRVAGRHAPGERDEAFIIGGARLYADALPIAHRLYLTRVHARIEGDTYFPPVDWGRWCLQSEDHRQADERHAFGFTFQVYERVHEQVEDRS